LTKPPSGETNRAYTGQFAATAAVPGADAGAPAVVAVAAVAQPGALCAPADGAEAAIKTTSDPMRTKRRRIDPPPFLVPGKATLLRLSQPFNKGSVKESSGERNCPRPTKRLAEASEHREVGVKRDLLQAAHAKRSVCPLGHARPKPSEGVQSVNACTSACTGPAPSSSMKTERPRFQGLSVVERAGLEPATSGLQSRRSPS
jgi:hypothetical protein